MKDTVIIKSMAEMDRLRERLIENKQHFIVQNSPCKIQVRSKQSKIVTTYIYEPPKFKTFNQDRFMVIAMHDDDVAALICLASGYESPMVMETVDYTELPRVLKARVDKWGDESGLEFVY